MRGLLLITFFAQASLLLTLTACAKVQTVRPDEPVDKSTYTYIQHLTRKIEIIGAARYPDLASHIKHADVIEFAFELSSSGKLESLQVIRPARSAELTAMMLDIIKYAAPYPPLPDDFKYDRIVIHKRWSFAPDNTTNQN